MYVADVRELRYFVAVAEEQHFGRAAQRLGIAQPPLSRAIRELERRLGVTLFDRSTRSVRLTEAGGILLKEGREALAAMTRASDQARGAGAGKRLRVVTKPEGDAGLLDKILPRYRDAADATEIELVVCRAGEQVDMLRDGSADVGFLHPPFDDLEGFDAEVLLIQSQVAVLPRGHRLARRSAIHLSDLDDDELPVWPARRPHDAEGPTVRDPGQLTTLVALAQLVAVVPQSIRRFGRTDIAYVPILDAPPSQVVLAWSPGVRSRALLAFRNASRVVAQQTADTATVVPR